MAESDKTLYEILNSIAARLPLLEPTDLSPLAAIAGELESIKSTFTLSSAFVTQIDRTISLINNIVMAETEFDTGCKKLGQSIAAMLKEAGRDISSKGEKVLSHEGKSTKTESDRIGAPSANVAPIQADVIPADLREIASKFAENQQAVLEDFEAYTLEMEKGVPEAKAAIRRILHTWKGEFGVLDMQEYSRLVHEIEDRLENGRVSTEQLLGLKDFLLDRMNRFAEGTCPAITETEREMLVDKSDSGSRLPVDCKEEKTGAATDEGQATDESRQSEAPLAKTPDRPFQADPSLVADFINESRDHVHTAETYLLELETEPSNAERIDAVFRAWHTVKGVAGFLGLREINVLAHSMESIMDRVRKHEAQLTPSCIDLLLEANDCLRNFVDLVEEATASGTLRIPENYDTLMLQLKNMKVCSGGKKLGEILIEAGLAKPVAVESAVEKQKAGDGRKIGEILIEEQNVPASAVENALATQNAARSIHAIEESIRVPVSRIDQLVDAIGEAVIAQSMIYAHPTIKSIGDQALHSKISHAAMIMRQIQEMAMALRMVSVKATFQKMARLARDLAKKVNKEIEFITEGDDTELDKSVVENIGDPLVHMVRNAIDHGVEPPDERIKAGKAARATVKLRAYHRAGNIYIELSDDGRGLDRDAIYKKALGKGLCRADDRLTDEEIYRFIFLPGFSTAKVVTDVSGRGVGMDVVRRNIEALRGSVEIASTAGKGTTFTIRLPLTLAIVDGMVVRAGSENYIIPTLSVIESLRPEQNQIETVLGKGKMIKVRGDLIPLVHLESLFSKNGNGNGNHSLVSTKLSANRTEAASDCVVMIVEDMLGKKIGLHLDEILGQQQVVIKSLGAGMAEVPGVTGGAIMSDGTISLILDIGGIVKLAEE